MVQHRAARFVKRYYRSTSSVTDLLSQLNWDSLQRRHQISCLVVFHKAFHGQSSISLGHLAKPSSSNRQPATFVPLQSRKHLYKFTFSQRTIHDWNLLPPDIQSLPLSPTFRSGVQSWSRRQSHNTLEVRGRCPLRRTNPYCSHCLSKYCWSFSCVNKELYKLFFLLLFLVSSAISTLRETWPVKFKFKFSVPYIHRNFKFQSFRVTVMFLPWLWLLISERSTTVDLNLKYEKSHLFAITIFYRTSHTHFCHFVYVA